MKNGWLASGFKYFLFLPLPGGDDPNMTNMFQMGWNHQLAGIHESSI